MTSPLSAMPSLLEPLNHPIQIPGFRTIAEVPLGSLHAEIVGHAGLENLGEGREEPFLVSSV